MRDKTLDIVKGLACLLMVFAHARTLGRTIETPLTDPFWQLGYFAPFLFFASIGVSLNYQLKKRTVLVVIIFNLLFFIFSYADRARESVDWLNLTNINLVGALALATIIGIVLRRFNGLIVFILFLVADRILNKFSLGTSILHGLPFSIIPWAGVVLLGEFLFEKRNWNLYFLLIGAVLTFYLTIIKQEIIENQLMTTLFLGISLIVYPVSLIISPMIEKVKYFSNILIYMGKNTLLFYWFHLIILFTVTRFVLPAVLIWIYVLALSLTGMYVLQKINKFTLEKISSNLWFWIILTSLVFTPLIISLTLQQKFYFLSPILIIFALNYHNFFKIKQIEILNK